MILARPEGGDNTVFRISPTDNVAKIFFVKPIVAGWVNFSHVKPREVVDIGHNRFFESDAFDAIHGEFDAPGADLSFQTAPIKRQGYFGFGIL